MSPTGVAPRFSPVLLLGMAVRPLPLGPLQPILSRLMKSMVHRHPDIFERLSCVSDARYLIDPTDLPFCFLLVLDKDAPQMSAIRDGEGVAVAARIRGPLLSLIDLLEGRADGDALFFSRTLSVEGDTEAVVALRNALDGEEINLFSDLLGEVGPLAGPVGAVMGVAGRLYTAASRDMESIARAINAPTERRVDSLTAQIKRFGEKAVERKPARRPEKAL